MIIETVDAGLAPAIATPRFFRRLNDAVFWLVALQRRHRERLQLAAMDDATLKDIGLGRCDVMAELRKPRWRR